MRTKFLKASVILGIVMLTACQAESEPVETSVSTSAAITEKDHILLRDFTINEAFEQITISGERLPFPIELSELDEGGSMADHRYENGILYFPDGGIAQANAENGRIYFLKFSKDTAPQGLALMNITLGASYDIVYSVGIPDENSENGDYASVWYTGVYGQYFKLDFNNKKLTDITIVQE